MVTAFEGDNSRLFRDLRAQLSPLEANLILETRFGDNICLYYKISSLVLFDVLEGIFNLYNSGIHDRPHLRNFHKETSPSNSQE
ncbi:hypothetical protein Nepgr_020730 [Nepenthes gracilis]|uniref:Uncharacterized protein n=1 Tax=Nepenthes gracilis TaxID=150966 RepID=A0AAD3SY53_NEPGR|nr:hypothetical protein Nepgr_020730 [Nepenthes gracilis]